VTGTNLLRAPAAGFARRLHRAPLARITEAFAAAVHRFAAGQRVPWADFARGQRKDDVMQVDPLIPPQATPAGSRRARSRATIPPSARDARPCR
jgi:hypothetical protein